MTFITKRERQIVSLLMEGYSSKQIAQMLFISQDTVSNHRKNILKKTGAKNTAQVVALALSTEISMDQKIGEYRLRDARL